jgi:hypothetical protein
LTSIFVFALSPLANHFFYSAKRKVTAPGLNPSAIRYNVPPRAKVLACCVEVPGFSDSPSMARPENAAHPVQRPPGLRKSAAPWAFFESTA